MKTTNPLRRQIGFSIVEIMVGVVIGMIAVLVIYQVFATSEGIKRNITAAGDAQQNGLLSSFMMGIELANAGNGLAVAAQDLGTCTPTAAMKDSLRPIPLLITAGASAITAAVPAPDVNGIVTITHTGAPAGIGASATLFNLGPSNLVQKVLYDVSGGNLRSTSLLDPDGVPSTTQPVNPIASNVLNVKVQYGIDTVGDGLVHHWVPAVSGTPYGDWDPATLLAAPVPTINRIKAARIAILVRSEQHDKDQDPDPGFNPPPVFNDCADGGTCYPVSFSVPAVVGQPYGWRYRIYETVIPLRNEVWNKEV